MISPTLNVPQARFLSMPHKFKAYIAGFGSGKTWVGCGGICKGIWEHPGINQGYFAPTYPQIRDIFYPTVEEVAADWGLNVKINEGNKEVHFYYGRQYRGWELVSGLDSSLLHLFTITQIFKEYLIMAGNTLTGLIPTIYTALDVVSREQVGFIPAVAKNAKADAAAKDQTVTAPVAPEAKTEDIVPGPSAPNTGDQNIGTVDVKITKSKMAPVKWNGEEQLALGPSGTYNTILADQFKQAFRALANEVEADLGALYFGASRAVGTAGTTPFGVKDDLSDAALARQVLEDIRQNEGSRCLSRIQSCTGRSLQKQPASPRVKSSRSRIR